MKGNGGKLAVISASSGRFSGIILEGYSVNVVIIFTWNGAPNLRQSTMLRSDPHFRGRSYLSGAALRRLCRALGPRFIGRVLPDSAANPEVPPFFRKYVTTPHSVATVHLIDEEGQPTLKARDEVLAFFSSRLRPEVELRL